MGRKLRLDKYLSDMGIGTRSEVKAIIRSKRISLNQRVCIKPETKVDIDEDVILYNGERLIYREYRYYMLNKPAGVVTATRDNLSFTVMELIYEKQRKDLFPVGRLDKDTEGLLLITNDGELAHKLLSPGKHVDKEYYAKIRGVVSDGDKEAFHKGVPIDKDYITLPAKLDIIQSGDISEIRLTIREGKFHQVKRMFEAVGKEVIYLKRLAFGGLMLDPELKPGQYRPLNRNEINALKEPVSQGTKE